MVGVPIEDNSTKLKEKREDYKKTFGTEEGKRVLKDLEKLCLYRSSIFDKEPMVMALQEGLRTVYLHITTIMDMDIEELERIAEAIK